MNALLKNRTRKSEAFTLVELLVVISIIALLLSILMPSLSRAREQAKKILCGSNLHQVALGLHLYAADYDGRLPLIRYWSQATQDLGPDNAENANFQMSALCKLGYLAEPKLFYSPSDKSRRPDTVGVFEHSFRADVPVDNPKAWDLVAEGDVASSELALTYSYQQVLFVAENLVELSKEKFLKITDYKTLVADRFCGDHMWSFHGGDEKLSLYENSTQPVPENGEGWHIGMADGAVVWRDNDRKIFDYMQDRRREFPGSLDFHHGGAWFQYWGKH